ncbi:MULTISPECIES: prepilin peptidase [unclassified Rhizobium]|uniref:A24 family peptidase n=1 Tax=unclassified Rhizobium TaxID=2613769 RepID=UPI0004702993|nr:MULTISPECIES: prepilin peptidase [unclassified Rhizobium]MBD9451799.1 prepilin peptidase [Rhizobium sp. RHZ02]
MTASVIITIFPMCLTFAAVMDTLTMTIPNRISAILLASFFALAPFVGMDWPTFGYHLLGGAVVFAACFVFFALNIMGGGDAKLLTTAAVWVGFGDPLVEFIGYVGVTGGLLAAVILLLRMQNDMITAIGLRVPDSLLVAKKIPYGIAIAIGGFVAFPSSPLFLAALEGLK